MKKEDLKKEFVKYFKGKEEANLSDDDKDIVGCFIEDWDRIVYGNDPDDDKEYQIEILLDDICCYF